jgi:hypothetical protein
LQESFAAVALIDEYAGVRQVHTCRDAAAHVELSCNSSGLALGETNVRVRAPSHASGAKAMNTPLFVCCTTALTLLASSPARAEPAAGPPAGAIAAAEQKDAQEEEPKVEITHVGGRRVFRITTSWVIEGADR